MNTRAFFPLVAAVAVACGGGEPEQNGSNAGGGSTPPASAPAAPALTRPTGAMTTPDWFRVDHTARTVNLSITAGLTPEQNHWNFNGYTNGRMAINVPEGYTVNIEFHNADPNMAHSLGISAETQNFAMPPQPVPVFPGAISQNPGSMVDGTMPNETETITFVAERAGNYSMVCYIPGHTAVGMWVWFTVTSGQEAGVQTVA
ncbi:MAG: sulfocyanin-like copper-binding protein [Gemmatimonadales bacterium]